MSNTPKPPSGQHHNGHRTIGPQADDVEPKGYPTSDRYQAETAHTSETDDHTKIKDGSTGDGHRED